MRTVIETMQVDLEQLKARNGQPTLRARFPDGRTIFLHSAYDPERETRQWAEKADFGANDVVVLFGCGAGYAAVALRERMSRNNHLLILDPLAASLSGDLLLPRETLADPRVQRTSNFREFREAYDRIENACWKGISLLRLPIYEKLFPEDLKELAHWVARQANTLKMHRDTVFASARLWQKNLFQNLVRLPGSGAVSSAFGSFQDKPAIIVSAGPSLTKNMHLLREAGDRALIIATGTAARLLHLKRLPYHLVISVDPNPANWKALFEGISHGNAVLVYDVTTTPEVVESHLETKAAFYSLPDCRWLDQFFSPPLGLLKTGGSVANIAFDLAVKFGCDPIVLIGQDLAYTDGVSHAAGAYRTKYAPYVPAGWFEQDQDELRQRAKDQPYLSYLLQKGRLSVPDIHGQPVWTDRNLFSFLVWFEQEIRRLGDRPMVVDATEGGAFIPGTTVKDLRQTLDEDCTAEVQDAIQALVRRLSTPVRLDGKELLNHLRKEMAEISYLQKNCDEAVAISAEETGSRLLQNKEKEILDQLDRLKSFLHFSLVPVLVQLGESPPHPPPSANAPNVQHALLRHLIEVLREAGQALEGPLRVLEACKDGSRPPSEGDAMQRHVDQIAQRNGYYWGDDATRGYYERAEQVFARQWEQMILPFIEDALPETGVFLELAIGHGRNTQALLPFASKLYAVDINEENVRFCKTRFRDETKIEYVLSPGAQLPAVPSSSVDFIYCFDAMVHFDSRVVESYIKEFKRILKPQGSGFCHHSNFTGNPGGHFRENPHARDFMSKELFAHYLYQAGLKPTRQQLIDWAGTKQLDCFTLFAN